MSQKIIPYVLIISDAAHTHASVSELNSMEFTSWTQHCSLVSNKVSSSVKLIYNHQIHSKAKSINIDRIIYV